MPNTRIQTYLVSNVGMVARVTVFALINALLVGFDENSQE